VEQEIKTWNPKGGRPKKKESELRNKRVTVKLTEAEEIALFKECEDLGWKQPLVYFRNKLLSKEGKAQHNPNELFRVLNKLNPELNKIGNNINQVAKYVNYMDKNGMVDAKFIAEYNMLFKELLKVQQEYSVAIRAYLRSLTDKQ